MDEVDHNLLAAWERVAAVCRADPAEARRRWRRSRGTLLRRVPRAWCLAVRASDTRLRPENYEYQTDDGSPFRQPHDIDLTGMEIRELCAPVGICWPGVTLDEAARMLGRYREAVGQWLPARPGRTRAARPRQMPPRYRVVNGPRFPFQVRYEKPSCHGRRGMDVPVVWSDRPLDPGADRGDPPHPLWGSLWQFLHQRIPDNIVTPVERVPDLSGGLLIGHEVERPAWVKFTRKRRRQAAGGKWQAADHGAAQAQVPAPDEKRRVAHR